MPEIRESRSLGASPFWTDAAATYLALIPELPFWYSASRIKSRANETSSRRGAGCGYREWRCRGAGACGGWRRRDRVVSGTVLTSTTPTPAAVAVAAAACKRLDAGLTGRLVLTDARGRYTALIYVSGDQRARLHLRRSPGSHKSRFRPARPAVLRGAGTGSARPPWQRRRVGSGLSRIQPQPANPTVRPSVRHASETHVYGLAGSDISTIAFGFADGATVSATLQHGWHFAWWPGSDYPTSVRVTTASGHTITSSLGAGSVGAAASSQGSELIPFHERVLARRLR